MFSTYVDSITKKISRKSREETTNIMKPNIVINYKKYMGCIDNTDQYTLRNTSSLSGTVERLNSLLHIIGQDGRGRSKDYVVCSNQKIKDGRRKSKRYLCYLFS
ncbi:piggyBac transposable element-derived protein 4-like [Vespula squamosa]|uniref:PiggyBac transposable element-derived protein 4-like n=1 Tax=Vespula squamosa TaxID=30214 RepID=A0ABD1ZWI6_VESSQ